MAHDFISLFVPTIIGVTFMLLAIATLDYRSIIEFVTTLKYFKSISILYEMYSPSKFFHIIIQRIDSMVHSATQNFGISSFLFLRVSHEISSSRNIFSFFIHVPTQMS